MDILMQAAVKLLAGADILYCTEFPYNPVILSGGRSPEPKDLRTECLHSSFACAKIPRRTLLARDDRPGSFFVFAGTDGKF